MDDSKTFEQKIPFNGWHVVDIIGQGSYGTVYKVTREEFNGYIQTCAVKVITFPTKTQIENAETAMGTDPITLTKYFEQKIQKIFQEIEVLDNLGNHPNIIGYKDHRIIRHTEGIGWDVYILMEYATPLRQYMRDHVFSNETGLRLGIDLLSALEVCEARKIIHRDIKDSNIFVDQYGVFKLGDFGIAKQFIERTGTATHAIGTPWYMAPEVYGEKHYDHRADLYSLGVVLYRYFNNQCMPFVPPEDMNTAFDMRMSGKPLPAPLNANEDATILILKACAFRAEDRFASALEMKQAFVALSGQKKGTNEDREPSEKGFREEYPVQVQSELTDKNGETTPLFGPTNIPSSAPIKKSQEELDISSNDKKVSGEYPTTTKARYTSSTPSKQKNGTVRPRQDREARNVSLNDFLTTQNEKKHDTSDDIKKPENLPHEAWDDFQYAAKKIDHEKRSNETAFIDDFLMTAKGKAHHVSAQTKGEKTRNQPGRLWSLMNSKYVILGSILLDIALIIVFVNDLNHYKDFSRTMWRVNPFTCFMTIMNGIMVGITSLDFSLAIVTLFSMHIRSTFRKKIGLIREIERVIVNVLVIVALIVFFTYPDYYTLWFGVLFTYHLRSILRTIMIPVVSIVLVLDVVILFQRRSRLARKNAEI